MPRSKTPVFVLQHTSGEFLGLIEDHLEGRGVRFTYFRPFTADGKLPARVDFCAGLILLGGGPWGTKGGRAVPTLTEELELTRDCLALGKPVVGIGLGAQILAIAAGGDSERADLVFEMGEAKRVKEDALNGFLPARYPLAVYMRDRPVPPDDAEILAVDHAGRPALFQVAGNCLGFTGHPGAKLGMVEDLIMEFEESPEAPWATMEALRKAQPEIEDALVRIMTGLVQITGLMRPGPEPGKPG
jgi:GMP synthase-like glutamine amidotransferase